MKKKGLPSKVIRIVSVFALILLVGVYFIKPFSSNAAALTAVYFYLSRMKANMDGSTDIVTYTLAVAPTSSISTDGTVKIEFPNADDGNWCRTNGALIVTGVSSAIPDLTGTDWDIDAVLPNGGSAISATCTKGTSGSTVDTILISNVGALTGGTTYGVSIANGSSAGVIGTDDTAGTHTVTVTASQGATTDTGSFDVYLLSTDSVTVSATVQAVPTVTCSISSTSVSLGTLFPGGSFNTITNTLSVSTSTTADGYYWSAFGTGDGSTDAGLYKSDPTTDLLASTGSSTIDLSAVGAEGFGITLSDPDGGGAAVVPADFSDSSFGTFGALDRTAANAQIVLYQNAAQSGNDTSTITYGGRAASAAEPGSYQEVVYFICGGYY